MQGSVLGMDAVNSAGSNSYLNTNSAPVFVMNKPSDSNTDAVLQTGSDINSEQALKAAEMQGKKVSIADEQFVKALEKVKKAIDSGNTTLQYSVHKETQAIMVKVLDKDTGKVVKEIPPEKILDMVAKFCEMAGIYVDKKV